MIPALLTPTQEHSASEEFSKLYPPEVFVPSNRPTVDEWVREAIFASLDDDYFPTRPLPVHRERS